MRWIACLAVVLLAGCTETVVPDEVTEEPPAPLAVPADFGLDVSHGEEAAFLAVTEEHPVAGYVVPVKSEPEDFGRYLQLAVLLDGEADAIVVSLHSLGGGRLLDWAARTEGTRTIFDAGGLPDQAAVKAESFEQVLRLPYGFSSPAVGVVVAAEGLRGSVAAAIRYDPEQRGGVASVDEIVADGALVPVPVGVGAGVELGIWSEAILGGPAVLSASVWQMGNVTMDDRLGLWVEGRGGGRDATIRASTNGAWSHQEVYALTGEGTMTWNYSLGVDGAHHDAEGVYVFGGIYGMAASSLVFGMPQGLAMARGSGEAVLDVRMASTATLHEILVASLSYHDDLEHLLGMRTWEYVETWDPFVQHPRAKGPLPV